MLNSSLKHSTLKQAFITSESGALQIQDVPTELFGSPSCCSHRRRHCFKDNSLSGADPALGDWKRFPVTMSHPGISTLLHKAPWFHPRGLVLSHTWWNRILQVCLSFTQTRAWRVTWFSFLLQGAIFRRINATNLDKNTFCEFHYLNVFDSH